MGLGREALGLQSAYVMVSVYTLKIKKPLNTSFASVRWSLALEWFSACFFGVCCYLESYICTFYDGFSSQQGT